MNMNKKFLLVAELFLVYHAVTEQNLQDLSKAYTCLEHGIETQRRKDLQEMKLFQVFFCSKDLEKVAHKAFRNVVGVEYEVEQPKQLLVPLTPL